MVGYKLILCMQIATDVNVNLRMVCTSALSAAQWPGRSAHWQRYIASPGVIPNLGKHLALLVLAGCQGDSTARTLCSV